MIARTRANDFVNRHRASLLLIVILLVALLLRLWGNGFGLPYLYHPDEDAVIMPALSILKSGNLEPTRMEYGTLYIYMVTAVAAAVFVLAARDGRITTPDQLPIFERGTYPAVYHFPEYFLAARTLAAFLGVGIVLLIYMLVNRLGNQRQALIAAAIAAVTPDLAKHAHFATPDIPLTFFTLLGLFLLVRAYDNWEHDTLWAYAGAGFVLGLAASTKYNGFVLIAPLLLVALFKIRRLDEVLSLRVLAGPMSMAAGFLAGTPYALLNLPKFLYWLGYSLHLYAAPSNAAVGTSWQWHLDYQLTGPDVAVFVLGLIGFFLSWRAWGWRRAALVNVVAVLLWLAIVAQPRREARMWLPTAPLFVAWTGVLVDTVILFLGARVRREWLRLAALGLIPLLIMLPLLWNTIQINQRFQATDVRTETMDWIEANLPPGTTVAVEYFAPPLDPAVYPVTTAARLHHRSVDWYQDQGIQYLVLSEAGNEFDKMSAEEASVRQTFAGQLCLQAELRGPFLAAESRRMWVYAVPPCP